MDVAVGIFLKKKKLKSWSGLLHLPPTAAPAPHCKTPTRSSFYHHGMGKSFVKQPLSGQACSSHCNLDLWIGGWQCYLPLGLKLRLIYIRGWIDIHAFNMRILQIFPTDLPLLTFCVFSSRIQMDGRPQPPDCQMTSWREEEIRRLSKTTLNTPFTCRKKLHILCREGCAILWKLSLNKKFIRTAQFIIFLAGGARQIKCRNGQNFAVSLTLWSTSEFFYKNEITSSWVKHISF